jgi:hypothetical protein
MAWNRGSYVNRLRFSDWQRLFRHAGLVPERVTPHADEGLLRDNRGHAYLRALSDEDLLTYRFDGVYRRDPAPRAP